jgi:hypothetical protein
MAFVLRSIDRETRALAELARVRHPGGDGFGALISPDGRGLCVEAWGEPTAQAPNHVFWVHDGVQGCFGLPEWFSSASVCAWSPDARQIAVAFEGPWGVGIAVYGLPVE